MLDEKVFIVAGGASGLGEGTARELADHGASVVISDLGTSLEGSGESADPAEATAEAIRDAGGEAMAHFGDVTSFDYTESLVADTVEEYGRLDGVVNFAGVLRDGISYKMSEDDWDAVVRVHLRGHFALLKHAAAHWREQAGEDRDGLDEQRAFLAVSSYSATKGTIGQANYCAAKAGILGMVRSTARELHRYNVRVNAIMPNAYTRMVEAIPGDLRPDEEELPHPEDVAPSVAFLLSDHAEDVTGCSFWVTGDEFGVVTNPELRRVGVDEDGWTAEGLADRFEDTIATGMDLTNVEASRDRDE